MTIKTQKVVKEFKKENIYSNRTPIYFKLIILNENSPPQKANNPQSILLSRNNLVKTYTLCVSSLHTDNKHLRGPLKPGSNYSYLLPYNLYMAYFKCFNMFQNSRFNRVYTKKALLPLGSLVIQLPIRRQPVLAVCASRSSKLPRSSLHIQYTQI